MTRGTRDWFLTECSRFEGWPGQGELFKLRVTESALEQIKRAALADLVGADGKALVDDAALTEQLQHARREWEAAQRTIARLGGVDA